MAFWVFGQATMNAFYF
jgi:hypothetical protein